MLQPFIHPTGGTEKRVTRMKSAQQKKTIKVCFISLLRKQIHCRLFSFLVCCFCCRESLFRYAFVCVCLYLCLYFRAIVDAVACCMLFFLLLLWNSVIHTDTAKTATNTSSSSLCKKHFHYLRLFFLLLSSTKFFRFALVSSTQ